MYLSLSNKKLRRAAIIGYFAGVILVPVLYYFAGIHDGKSIIAYVIGVVIIPGIMTMASWLQYRHDTPPQAANRGIKGLPYDTGEIQERLSGLAQEKKWRIINQTSQRMEFETPVSFMSFGEFIVVETMDREVFMSVTPKIGLGRDIWGANSEKLLEIEKSLTI